MKENNQGKEILKLIQDNYDIKSAQDLSSALKDMFKGALQEMMNAEFDSSMGYSKYDKKSEKTNYRNGSTKKTLKSEFGEFEIETPRDRKGEFEPKIVPKNTRDVLGIEDKVISLYARGLTTREINEEIQDLYGIEISATMVIIYVKNLYIRLPMTTLVRFIRKANKNSQHFVKCASINLNGADDGNRTHVVSLEG